MSDKVKSVLTIVSEALEAAAGYALVAVGIYAALFVDVTGGGTLWNSLHNLKGMASEAPESPNGVRVIKVPAQVRIEKIHEDRLLAVFDSQPPVSSVSALYQPPELASSRPSAALTDTPADPTSGKTWKRGLNGELRHFTVYGKGEATTSAVGARTSVAAPAQAQVVATVQGSPAKLATETGAVSRPGMSSRLSRGTLAASETSRNVR